MRKQFKKIISAALVVVMALTMVFALQTGEAQAATKVGTPKITSAKQVAVSTGSSSSASSSSLKSGASSSKSTSSGSTYRALYVKWGKVSGATKYQVAYKKSGGSWTYKTTTSLSYTTGKLSAGTYTVKVRAYKKGYGSWSSTKTVKIK